MSTRAKWERIITLQQEVKAMLLLTEEHNGGNYETYIQPVKEQRDALSNQWFSICRLLTSTDEKEKKLKR